MRFRWSVPVFATIIALTAAVVPAVAALGDCGQPISTGSTSTASDCLFMLNAAVGAEGCVPECICDTNGNGTITASDALTCLAKAVGQDVTLDCACSVTTTTSTTTTTIFLPTCGLLKNGDFEAPVLTSGQNGWSFGNVGGAGAWQAAGGNPGGFFRLHASGQVQTDPTVSQTVDGLSAGVTYRITGDYRSYEPSLGDPNKLDAFAVTVDPQPSDHESTLVLGIPRPSPDANAWTEFTVDFVASNQTVTVSFIAERDGDDSSFDVDNLCLELQ